MRAGSCWRVRWYWSCNSVGWSVVGGLGGAAEVSGVPELLSVVVRSMVGLLGGGVVLVTVVWMLSVVVPGLSFVSVAVGAGVEISGSSFWSWGGGQWAALCFEVAGWDCVGCAVWLYVLGCLEAGTVFPDGEALEGRRCWEVDRAVLVEGLP